MTEAVRRQTKQQAAVLAALDAAAEFVSAQQLHSRLRDQGASVGLATVYRTLTVRAAQDEVDVLRTDDGEAVYRRCASDEHHHHLVCRVCGRAVEVDGPAVEDWAARVSAAHGFRDVRHTLEIFGTCDRC